jgi:hypothetical protein
MFDSMLASKFFNIFASMFSRIFDNFFITAKISCDL